MLFTAMLKIIPFPPFRTVISLSRHLYFSGPPPDLFFLNILANCYCRLGYVDLGFFVFALIIKFGFPPTIKESHGCCMPNVVIYSTIIDSLCKDQLLPQALRIFAEMKTKASRLMLSPILP
ncbi:hypothetical protein RDABS01_029379 [Bienertia sinuspersici]